MECVPVSFVIGDPEGLMKTPDSVLGGSCLEVGPQSFSQALFDTQF